jgi:hypothetical protein
MTTEIPDGLQHDYTDTEGSCPRCNRLVTEIVAEHVGLCPGTHLFADGKFACGFNLVPLCEGTIRMSGLEYMYGLN